MLLITVPARECWDERKEEFLNVPEHTLQLEHSLVSISKWEAKWHKPFLSKADKTVEETLDYVRCMTMNKNVHPAVYNLLTADNIRAINAYIEDSMTATTLPPDKSGKTNKEIVTSELIYYWMITLGIPHDYRKWHLNRLLTLIQVCNIKNAPPKKRSQAEIMAEHARINAERKARLNTRG